MNWKAVHLDEVILDCQNGISRRRKVPENAGTIVLRIRDVGAGVIDYSDLNRIDLAEKEIKSYQLHNNDLLLVRVNGNPDLVGRATVFKEISQPVAFNDHLIRVRLDSKRIEPKYIELFLNSSYGRSRLRDQVITTAGQFTINRTGISNVVIPLPSIEEQKRIATIAQKADRLRRTRRYTLELSDSYLRSVFLEMFGDPITNVKGFEVTDLNSVCKMIRDGTHKTPQYIQSGVPFITVKNIISGYLDFRDTKFISPEEHTLLTKRVKPEKGDILVSKDGTIGVPCVIKTDREFSIFVSVAILKPIGKVVNSDFLAWQIRSDALQKQINDGIKGISIRHLHLEDFKELRILLPPLPLQQKFAQIVQRYERLRIQQREAERQAEHLFQTILHRAFRGEI